MGEFITRYQGLWDGSDSYSGFRLRAARYAVTSEYWVFPWVFGYLGA
jgi:hypothetical protein